MSLYTEFLLLVRFRPPPARSTYVGSRSSHRFLPLTRSPPLLVQTRARRIEMSAELSAPEIVRKRSRSSSPTDANSPAAAKQPNIDASASAPVPELAPPNAEDLAQETPKPLPDLDAVPAAVPDESTDQTMTDADHELPTKPAVDAVALSAEETAAAEAAAAAASSIQMRALIVTQDASFIIGKAGKNVNEIREKSGSKITITEAVAGNPERVMVVAGQLDAVSKVRMAFLVVFALFSQFSCNRHSVWSCVGSTTSPLMFPPSPALAPSPFGGSFRSAHVATRLNKYADSSFPTLAWAPSLARQGARSRRFRKPVERGCRRARRCCQEVPRCAALPCNDATTKRRLTMR